MCGPSPQTRSLRSPADLMPAHRELEACSPLKHRTRGLSQGKSTGSLTALTRPTNAPSPRQLRLVIRSGAERPAPNCGRNDLCVEQWQPLKLPAEYLERRQSEPLIEQRRIDAPEVDRPRKVAVPQVSERGCFADEAGLHARAGEENGARGTVVGAERSILCGPAAELAEGHHNDTISQLDRGQVVEKCTDRPGEVA